MIRLRDEIIQNNHLKRIILNMENSAGSIQWDDDYNDEYYHDDYHDDYGDVYRDVYVDDRYSDNW